MPQLMRNRVDAAKTTIKGHYGIHSHYQSAGTKVPLAVCSGYIVDHKQIDGCGAGAVSAKCRREIVEAITSHSVVQETERSAIDELDKIEVDTDSRLTPNLVHLRRKVGVASRSLRSAICPTIITDHIDLESQGLVDWNRE